MTEKQIIRKFIVGTFDCSGYFFESAWKHVESNYKKSASLILWRNSLSVLYDNTRTDKQYDAIKSLSILYETIKEIERTGKAGQFLSLLEEISKKHKAEEELKLKILKNIDAVNRQMQDFLCDKSKIAEDKHGKDETLELSLNERGKPEVKINGRNITIKERFFVDLAYLAVCKLKRPDGWVEIKKELKWTERHIKDYPTDFKEVFERGVYLKAIDKDRFLDRIKGQGKIGLGVFKPGSITINKNLCNFISEHYWTVKKAIDAISYDLSCRKAGGRKIDSETTDKAIENQEINLEKIDSQELRPMLRHIFVISQTVKLMGWKFHDAEWLKEWVCLLRKCEKIYELAKFDEKYNKDSSQYIRSYLTLFSRTA